MQNLEDAIRDEIDTLLQKNGGPTEPEVMAEERIWTAQPLSEIHSLTELRSWVLHRNAERCPKWKFRMSDDLVMQVQPKARRILFEGTVIQGRDIPANAFQRHVGGFLEMRFVLQPHQIGTGWQFRPTAIWGMRRYGTEMVFALRDRTLAALPRLEQLDISMMFQPACLACGKKLTDPVSRARWFGPECAGTAALDAVRAWRVAA